MAIRRTLLVPLLCFLGAVPRPAYAAAPTAPAAAASLNANALNRSMDLGLQYLMSCQRLDGSLIYEVDAVRGVDLGTRHAVREMGGLWAMALMHRRHPTPETAAAIVKALKHHDRHARRTATGGRYLCEPGAPEWATNFVALNVLTLLDFLAADHDLDPAFRKKCEKDLADEVKFLLSLRLGSGRFYSTYHGPDGRGLATPTPYADGETLLGLVRYAKQSGDEKLRETVLASAAAMYGEYVRSALRADPNSDAARGFYQWGSMAIYELYTSGWPVTKPYAARTIAMARWMIDNQNLLRRPGNSGYAYEGLAVAWELARLTNDVKNQQHIGATISAGLPKLLSWQIGSPYASPTAVPKTFLKSPKTRGGIVNAAADPRLRIDVVQHQLHASMLVHWFFFRPDEAADGR